MSLGNNASHTFAQKLRVDNVQQVWTKDRLADVIKHDKLDCNEFRCFDSVKITIS